MNRDVVGSQVFDAALLNAIPRLETPFYYYDMTLLAQTLRAAKMEADRYGFHLHYALKANFNDRILEKICEAGFGADCVAGNEVRKAIQIGFRPEQIVFAGVGKSDKEIHYALEQQIFAFNVESMQELDVIQHLAAEQGRIASIALRINPNVDAHTHHYITTGLDENKFGIMQSDLGECLEVLARCPNLQLAGVHFHVGSQITDMEVFRSLCVKANEINQWFDERGHRLRVINVGGGLGVDYHRPDEFPIPDFASYFAVFARFLELKDQQEVHFELGRSLVAQCGSLFSRVLYLKHGIKKNFMILDAGMTELMRPALYQAYHKIELASPVEGSRGSLRYDVVGPICESSDCFGKEVLLPVASRGDVIAIRSAGAYGEVMASRYNLREELRYVYSDMLEG